MAAVQCWHAGFLQRRGPAFVQHGGWCLLVFLRGSSLILLVLSRSNLCSCQPVCLFVAHTELRDGYLLMIRPVHLHNPQCHLALSCHALLYSSLFWVKRLCSVSLFSKQLQNALLLLFISPVTRIHRRRSIETFVDNCILPYIAFSEQDVKLARLNILIWRDLGIPV